MLEEGRWSWGNKTSGDCALRLAPPSPPPPPPPLAAPRGALRTTSSLKGWTRLGIVASRQMQAKLAPDVEIRDKNYRLSKALYLLN